MISLYFGSPGAGKTSLAARIVYKETTRKKKRYERIYTNFECVGAYAIDSKDFSTFTPIPHSLVIIDEAGIDFNNRKFKDLKQQIIEFFKLHRHYEVDIVFLSQSWEDCDITIRRLANALIYIRKLGPFTICRRVRKFVFVDKDTHQITEGYEFYGIFDLLKFIIYPYLFQSPFFVFLRSPYYFMFDSYSKIFRPAVPRGKYFEDRELPQHLYRYRISTAYLRLKSKINRIIENRKRVKK